MKNHAFTLIKNKYHSRVLLSGISTLEKAKEAETPDTDTRGWRNNRAFTLIELLVVVLIIGILAAIALPQYQRTVLKTRMAEVYPRMKNIEDAVELYIMQNGFPSSQIYLEDINPDIMGGLTLVDGAYHTYCSEYTAYSVYCNSTQCTLTASFNTKGEPHTGAFNQDDIGLERYFLKSTNQWKRYCSYARSNKHGLALCKLSESLGSPAYARD